MEKENRKYEEGLQVADKFEKAMKLLFHTPKPEIERRKQRTPAPSVRKTEDTDKD